MLLDNSLPNMMLQPTISNHLENDICSGNSTNVMLLLQIHPFLTNKANFPKSQMNVTKVLTGEYEKWTLGERGKNKANSNPIKANLLNAQMNINKVLTKGSEKKLNWAISENKPNFSPKQSQTNPIFGVPILQYVAKWGPSDYPCVFELAVYNLVLRDNNLTNFY